MLFYPFVIFFLCVLLVYKSRFFRIEGVGQWEISLIYGLKVLAGYVFIYLYTYYYGNGNLSADAGQFISESKTINNLFFESPWAYVKLMFGFGEHDEITREFIVQTNHWDIGTDVVINDNKNVLRGNSLVHFISAGIPIIHCMIYSLVGLLGLKYIHRLIQKHSQVKPRVTFYLLCFLLPSLFFWTSTFLKEPMMFFGLAIFLYSLDSIVRNGRNKTIPLLLSGVILISFKPYVFLCLIPGIVLGWIWFKFPQKKYYFFASIIFLAIIGWFSFPKKVDQLTYQISKKQFDFVNISKGGIHIIYNNEPYFIEDKEMNKIKIKNHEVKVIMPIIAKKHIISQLKDDEIIHFNKNSTGLIYVFSRKKSKSYFEATMINSNKIQLIKNIPEAITNTLFRPFPNNNLSPIQLPALIENSILLLLLILSILYRRKIPQKDQALIITLTIFSILLCIIIGWTTPISGAIVRYRIPIQLSILMISLILISPKKLSVLFRSNRK